MEPLYCREDLWKEAAGPWDILVIGGGITGAGVFRLAAAMGLKVLLAEQSDFAWGTSSRSGKLVHGGLRYLRQGQIKTTLHSVKERERLISEAPGLVEPLEFLLPVYPGQAALKAAYRLGLGIYDLMAGRKTRRTYSREEFAAREPSAAREDLLCGLGYQDACADDARLVIRLIMEAVDEGGRAVNYAPATDLTFGPGGLVNGAVIKDRITGKECRASAKVVINATGAWADKLRGRIGRSPVIRPLKGSHLIFPGSRIPLGRGLSFLHPRDRRPVYAVPWEGVTLVGTTDLDHPGCIDEEPAILPREKDYLLAAVREAFPSLNLKEEDIVSTFAGVRPVVGSGRKDPSREARDILVMDEDGLLTVTGGKLTTFRLLALRALEAAGRRIVFDRPALSKKRVYSQCLPLPGQTGQYGKRLAGRYGARAGWLAAGAGAGEMSEIPGTSYLWAELRHAARHEMAVHLDDLLLRRLRLGLLITGGGSGMLEMIRDIVCPAMGWDGTRWREECDRYDGIWSRSYRPVGKGD